MRLTKREYKVLKSALDYNMLGEGYFWHPRTTKRLLKARLMEVRQVRKDRRVFSGMFVTPKGVLATQLYEQEHVKHGVRGGRRNQVRGAGVVGDPDAPDGQDAIRQVEGVPDKTAE